MKVLINDSQSHANGVRFYVDFYDSPNVNTGDGNYHYIDFTDFASIDPTSIKSAIETYLVDYAFNTFSWVVTPSDFIWLGPIFIQPSEIASIQAATQARVVTDGVSHSFVTTAAAANGFQVSSTRDSLVSYSITASSAVQIGIATNVSGYCILEVAATNSTTAGDWKEKGRVGTGQNISLALALSSTQVATAPLVAMVPAGYYARLRTVNTNGTPTYTYVSGTEVLM